MLFEKSPHQSQDLSVAISLEIHYIRIWLQPDR